MISIIDIAYEGDYEIDTRHFSSNLLLFYNELLDGMHFIMTYCDFSYDMYHTYVKSLLNRVKATIINNLNRRKITYRRKSYVYKNYFYQYNNEFNKYLLSVKNKRSSPLKEKVNNVNKEISMIDPVIHEKESISIDTVTNAKRLRKTIFTEVISDNDENDNDEEWHETKKERMSGNDRAKLYAKMEKVRMGRHR